MCYLLGNSVNLDPRFRLQSSGRTSSVHLEPRTQFSFNDEILPKFLLFSGLVLYQKKRRYFNWGQRHFNVKIWNQIYLYNTGTYLLQVPWMIKLFNLNPQSPWLGKRKDQFHGSVLQKSLLLSPIIKVRYSNRIPKRSGFDFVSRPWLMTVNYEMKSRFTPAVTRKR